ncbi:phage major capsid protein, partial [Winkia neuii]
PPILGRRTIVTPAIAEGKVLVGSSAAATVYRKGGVTLTSTNSNEDDFVHNLFLILAEERLAFAVRQPSAFALLELKKPVTEAA